MLKPKLVTVEIKRESLVNTVFCEFIAKASPLRKILLLRYSIIPLLQTNDLLYTSPHPIIFHVQKIDLLLLGITVILTLFGLARIVSVFESYQLTQHLTGTGTNSFYLWRSFLHVIFSLGVMGVTTVILYHFWQRQAKTLFFLTMVLVLFILVPGINGGGLLRKCATRS